MNSEAPCLIGCGRDGAALGWVAMDPDDDPLASELGMPLLLDGGLERIHLDMQNSPHGELLMKKAASLKLGRPSRSSRSADAAPRALRQSLLYSKELGIDLAQGTEGAYFRWFLASLLFGARITETTAKNTYRAFVRHGLTSPSKIVAAGWDFLVNPVMREGGYVRYDGRKSMQVLRDCETLLVDYGGSLRRLHDAARDARELEDMLLKFYGVGPVTVNIFLRELRPYWLKADPEPLPIVKKMAKKLNVDLARYPRKSLIFASIEAGLIRRRGELS